MDNKINLYLSLFSLDNICLVKRVKIEYTFHVDNLDHIMKEFRNSQVKNITRNKKESPKNYMVICEDVNNNKYGYFAHFPIFYDEYGNTVKSGYYDNKLYEQLDY